jgi:F0F1-type ATP synthase assembly protein I
MKPERTPSREVGEGYSYVGLGYSFGIGVVLFVLAGLALDRWLHLTPVFTIVGTLVGSVLSFLNVYWKLRADSDARQSGKKE